MMNPDAISSWSGGKDSCFAMYKAMQKGYRVKLLLNFVSRSTKRGCFHGIDGKLLKLQAECIGIPLIQWEVSPDMENYEKEFKEAVNHLRKPGIETMVFGDIYLLEHESWVERVCKDLNIRALEPLWNDPVDNIINDFLEAGFKTVIISCKSDRMGKEYLGKTLDSSIVNELKAKGICPCGEKGEFHTLVVDGPIFRKRIEILDYEKIEINGFWKHWFLDIKSYKTTDKIN